MEAVIALVIFVVVGALAARFGHDNRDVLRSNEHHLTGYGLTWGNNAATRPSPPDAPLPSHNAGD